jgi:8-oxo-dGTP pyrophosphatase MutT (NUDIX family)
MPAKNREEISAGGVVFRRFGGMLKYLLILDGHGNWGFPKGHLEEGESASDAAHREIVEETGLSDLISHAALRQLDWTFRVSNALVHKRCVYFLFETTAGETRPQGEEGITQCTWFAYADAISKLTFQNTRTLLTEAAGIVDRLSPLRPAGNRS